jgi:DnaJ-domain-containing protein 1
MFQEGAPQEEPSIEQQEESQEQGEKAPLAEAAPETQRSIAETAEEKNLREERERELDRSARQKIQEVFEKRERGYDPYAILGVSETASQDEIRKQWTSLAKQYHPDWRPTDTNDEAKEVAEKKMREINEAYDMVGREANRKRWDSINTSLNRKQRKTQR